MSTKKRVKKRYNVKGTRRQLSAIRNVVENGGNEGRAMVEAGYSPATAKNPSKLTKSRAWELLMEKHLSDAKLARAHDELLNSHRLEHMVFPLAAQDEEIQEMLASVNCKAKKIMHGEQATHCWFWSPDNKARKEALDMAYKLKDKYPRDKGPGVVVPLQINFKEDRDNYAA